MAVEPALPWGQRAVCIALSLLWLAFQFLIIWRPQDPLAERTVHVALALALLFLNFPLSGGRLARIIDWILSAAALATGIYYQVEGARLIHRIEMVDPILGIDVAFGVVLLALLLEGVRRTVGWPLLAFLLFVLFFGFAGRAFPGWSRFRGFSLEEMVEILTMTTNGVLGLTTETSVQLVFYFIAFGAAYAAIGGGRLLIDIGLAVAGRHQGGAAKAAVVSSSLMGTVSGSAVSNVVSVGVFTIPLMRRAGYSPSLAAGIEAICSTGGQLTPPVMGVAAFVLAEILQIEYGRVALAALIPALAFYFALFLVVDLGARKTGIGTLPPEELQIPERISPRLYLLLPPGLLIALLAFGYSATIAVVAAILACPAVCHLRPRTRVRPGEWLRTAEEIGKQACQVAVPIASIGIIIAIAVQSNLALRFSTRLIEGGGGNLYGALGLTILGCIVMGMGLPTVAAYIIGAILFAPVLVQLGVAPLAAHFFVMYYCVLSMVTPPVALASFAAAGLAGASAMTTGWQAFRLSLVLFLIPLGFVFDPRLLGEGTLLWIGLAFVSLLAATGAWAVALTGYLGRHLCWSERVLAGAASVATILFPTGTAGWAAGLAAMAAVAFWILWLAPRAASSRAPRTTPYDY